MVSGVVTRVNGELLWWVRHSECDEVTLSCPTWSEFFGRLTPGWMLTNLTRFWTQPCFYALAIRWPKLVVPWKSFEPQAANWNLLSRERPKPFEPERASQNGSCPLPPKRGSQDLFSQAKLNSSMTKNQSQLKVTFIHNLAAV